MTASTLTGLALGIALVAVYLIASAYREQKPTLVNAGVILLSTEGIVAGFRLAYAIFDPAFLAVAAVHGINPWHLVFAGFALMWLSVLGIVQSFREER
jgi:hypothetical protein